MLRLVTLSRVATYICKQERSYLQATKANLIGFFIDLFVYLFMSPPEGLGDILFFPGRLSVRPSVCLSRIVSAL